MAAQNYENHARFVPMYHYVLFALLLLSFIGSCANLYQSIGDHQRLYSASLLVVVTFCLIVTALFARLFALKAQDRAIRVEENLRHYVMTGKLLDPRLDTRRIIGLRFASDEEFLALADRAASRGMSEKEIKQAVKTWRADEYRV